MAVVEHSVSPRTVVTVVVAALIVVTLWQLTDVLLLVVSAMLLAAALGPLVKRLHKFMPVPLSAIVILLVLLLPVVWVVATVVPNFLTKLPSLIQTIGTALANSPYVPYSIRTLDFSQYAQNLAGYVISSTTAIAGAVITSITLVFLTYYIIVDHDRLKVIFLSLVPKRDRDNVDHVITEFEVISGRYIRGNLLISLICAVLVFIGYFILGIPYAGQLAVFAGILDLFPLIGAVGGSLPAIILGLLISPLTGFLTFLYVVVYQQIENHLIAPRIYNKALNLMPSLTVVAVFIGASLFGIAGAFLALPVAAGVPLLIEFSKKEKLIGA